MSELNEIAIDRFSRKHVKKLQSVDNIWTVIELMHDFKIRHVPIEDGSSIKGIINPRCLMQSLENYTDPSTFNQELQSISCQDFITVAPQESVFDVVKQVSLKKGFAALVMDGSFTEGIYTEIDILNTDFFWLNLADKVITASTNIGLPINEFTCVPSESTIQQALEFMLRLDINHLGIIDETSKTLNSVVDFMDIIRFLMYNYHKLNYSLEYLLEHKVSTLFPSPGVYINEPLLLSTLRKELYLNDVPFAILLDENTSYPFRIISITDLLFYLVEHSDYFGSS